MKMLGTHIEKRFGLGVVFIFSIIILFAFLGAIIPISTPAKKAMEKQQEIQQTKVEQQLFKATERDLVEDVNGKLNIVMQTFPERKEGEIRICRGIYYECGPRQRYFIKDIASATKRVIYKTNPDYPAAAVKFISQ